VGGDGLKSFWFDGGITPYPRTSEEFRCPCQEISTTDLVKEWNYFGFSVVLVIYPMPLKARCRKTSPIHCPINTSIHRLDGGDEEGIILRKNPTVKTSSPDYGKISNFSHL
jgi:hypothetical protein